MQLLKYSGIGVMIVLIDTIQNSRGENKRKRKNCCRNEVTLRKDEKLDYRPSTKTRDHNRVGSTLSMGYSTLQHTAFSSSGYILRHYMHDK